MRATSYFSRWLTLLSAHNGSLTNAPSDNVMVGYDRTRGEWALETENV